MILEVKVRPSSAKDEVLNYQEPAFLEIALKAKAENNEANYSLCHFLAKTLGLSKEKIKIIKGKTTRKKLVLIEGMSAEEIKERLKK